MSPKASVSELSLISSRNDITQHEIEALKTSFNLADAHTHQSQSATQRRIVESLPSLWYSAEMQTQHASEQEFIETFYRFHGQRRALQRKNEIYLVYAASIAMHITATYMRQHGMKAGLIEPCFDNLHDLMKHMQVPMTPLGEHLFSEAAGVYQNLQQHAHDLDAIVLVDPNNPSGFSMLYPDPAAFKEVVRFCVDHNKLLVLDFCFASFILASGGSRIDVYDILEDSGVRYIAMEDTGKTWPLQDAKCATLMSSHDLNYDIYQILTSVLLNVSPFILRLVTRYIQDSGSDDFASVREVLEINRKCAQTQLAGTMLRYCEPIVKTSVAWFQITDPSVDADALQAYLLRHDVYVLSGKYFYWHHPERGQRFIRIALARRPELFVQAIAAIRNALESYGD
ncbi:MAG: aminotransferase class I/II-fold pyridoxal phosphate-dependent enzyme [Rhodospirillales bacterium]|nr:aminotransferase class I/II-fold pyridoxal phosphate-dependent enzyme [Rhodospirillales bacterium]